MGLGSLSLCCRLNSSLCSVATPQDIGRHPGGKEILIAAGFELGEIDGVPSFISKEPDLESDMDRWSAWFDLLKATLALLDEHLKKM